MCYRISEADPKSEYFPADNIIIPFVSSLLFYLSILINVTTLSVRNIVDTWYQTNVCVITILKKLR